jgi:hypothetical protein
MQQSLAIPIHPFEALTVLRTSRRETLNNIYFFRMRNEFTGKQHQTEIVNFNEYSNRRQKELVKRHALSQKQFPKNIKVKTRRNKDFFLTKYLDETSGYQTST